MNSLPPLFPDRDRGDPGPRRGSESRIEFLDRVAGEFWTRLRGVLNRWFAAYPQAAASDLGERFRGDDVQHDAAWWELYLHQVLTGTGHRMTPHPEVPGTTSRPDFLVEGPEDERWYLEAAVLGSDDLAAERRRAVIVDALNSIESPYFYMCISWRSIGTSSPPTKGLRRSVRQWLETLHPLNFAHHPRHQYGDLPELRWEHDDWMLVLRALPKGVDKGQDPGPTVGIQAFAGWLSDFDACSRERFVRKATSYGEPLLPFVLAVRTTVPFAKLDGVLHELADGRVTVTDGHSRLRRVSGILVAGPEFQPWSVCDVTPVFVSNVTAAHALTAAMPWPETLRKGDSETMERNPLPASLRALGLPEDFRELKQRPFSRRGPT